MEWSTGAQKVKRFLEPEGRVLFVAYHFPPCSGTSGVLRSLKFGRYLPESGWRPIFLTVTPRAYEQVDTRTENAIPKDLPVHRAFALDTRKHLGVAGHFPDWLAMPDRWASWLLAGIPSGIRLVRNNKIDVILTTFPICTAVLIGLVLHLLTRKPWVVDLRDPIMEDDYPPKGLRRLIWHSIERSAMRHAARVIFTTASSRRNYLKSYSSLAPEKCLLIPNGYDEEDFSCLSLREAGPVSSARPLRLWHAGELYPKERDPRPFFRALMRLKRDGRIGTANLQVFFRGPYSEAFYNGILSELAISDLVQLLPRVPHREALQECADADGLLLFQAANSDRQIPAKAYEYLRLRKPILALTTKTGATAALLNEVGGATIVNLADEDDIYRSLPAFLEALRTGTHPQPDSQKILRYARSNQAKELAKCLFELKNEASANIPEKKGILAI
jgi:glycosyltransferase involved in cell wall biosynthesis